ncbi:hypothetical protein ACFSRY_08015 [Pontibacter locisalis]|uniref:Uncharacterized protein n=1 Tax=Pontibacter locisalis TaxID=1719035 RepID=A0ABW5IKB5_9BACT
MAKNDLNWHTTEAHFLEALLLATGGEGSVPLQEVLLMADAIDGTVFTLDEVAQAMLKLLAAGLLTIQKNKLIITQEALSLIGSEAEVEKDRLLILLQTRELTPESVSEAEAVLKRYKLKNYYQQYVEQFG